MPQEQQILNAALKAFEKEADIKAEVLKLEVKVGDIRVDAIVELNTRPKKIQFNAEVKRWAQNIDFGALIYQCKQITDLLLVADYVNPKMATRLREENIEFIDCAGNAYVDKENIKIWVKGNPKPQKMGMWFEYDQEKPIFEETVGAKIYTATGLKVIYQYLVDPTLLNAPYRTIAGRADVALGNIGWLMRDLIAGEYITQRGQGRNAKRKLRDYKRLLHGFTENYPGRLKQKQDLGTFYVTNPRWYLDIDIAEFKGLWGGEYAAGNQTNYLKAEDGTIYLQDRMLLPALVAAARLKGGREPEGKIGKVQILQAFWAEKHTLHYRENTCLLYTSPSPRDS